MDRREFLNGLIGAPAAVALGPYIIKDPAVAVAQVEVESGPIIVPRNEPLVVATSQPLMKATHVTEAWVHDLTIEFDHYDVTSQYDPGPRYVRGLGHMRMTLVGSVDDGAAARMWWELSGKRVVVYALQEKM